MNNEEKYTAMDFAKYMVNKCMCEKKPISNLQLQKILYYIQKTYLDLGNIAFEEDFEAWQFGPVIPSVYSYFCGFGGMPIRMLYEEEIDIYDKNIVDPIIENKRLLNPWDLVEETHEKGKAWDLIYKDGLGNYNIIPKELIKNKG